VVNCFMRSHLVPGPSKHQKKGMRQTDKGKSEGSLRGKRNNSWWWQKKSLGALALGQSFGLERGKGKGSGATHTAKVEEGEIPLGEIVSNTGLDHGGIGIQETDNAARRREGGGAN